MIKSYWKYIVFEIYTIIVFEMYLYNTSIYLYNTPPSTTTHPPPTTQPHTPHPYPTPQTPHTHTTTPHTHPPERKEGLERHGLNVSRLIALNVAWLALTRKTETLGEPVFRRAAFISMDYGQMFSRGLTV